jgi:LPXTG-site transpeptidase (sortase) family protein
VKQPKSKPKLVKTSKLMPIARQPARVPKLPFLHKKRYYLPLLSLSIATIIVLLSLPFLPQAQSAAQNYTKQHPAIAKIAPATFKPPNLAVPTSGNWLVIPAASIKLPINEGSSINILVKDIGVWHETGAITGNYVIAGHKLQYYRTVNQSLYHLNLLKAGDNGIYVVLNGIDHQYQVIATKIVSPTDVAILDTTLSPQLTIYTCNDFFNHSRFVVTAVPVS